MQTHRQAALELVPHVLAESYRMVPLGYDGQTMRVATIAENAAALDDVRQFLGVARLDVEIWAAERVAEELATAYPAPPPPPPEPWYAAARDILDGVLAVGSAVVCHMVGRLVRGRSPLATAEGYRCPCGRHLVVGFHPSGRVFTVHCPSYRHAFVHFECGRPPEWWRERVHYMWL